MRQIAFAFIVLLLFSASEAQDTKKPALPAITMPMIDREVKTVTTEKVTVNRTCPAGYEGHYVDVQATNFNPQFPIMNGPLNGGGWSGSSGDVVYAVCFKNDFMETLKKNPDSISLRPSSPYTFTITN